MIVNKNVIITYKNIRNMSVTLEPYGNYNLKVLNESLTDNINFEPQTGLDGGNYISDRLDHRTVNIVGTINSYKYDNHKLLQQLMRVFNPKLEGVLTYYNKFTDETFTLDCKPTKVVDIYIDSYRTAFDIELIALNPFWHGKSITEIIAETIKLAKFPLIIQKESFIFAKQYKALQSTFENIGDIDIGFTVEFFAQFGTVKNPVVYHKATGSAIRIEYEMKVNDTIKIVNYPHLKSITLNNKISLFDNIDLDEIDFFTLHAGENTICYDAEENYSNLKVVLKYAPDYLGVG